MKYVTLNNGVKMPILGFGVFQIPKEDTKRCVIDAIEVGYRSIDTAQSYYNEKEVGEAIEDCKIPREELFITTKVWVEHYGYEKTRDSVLRSMNRLKVDYLDLVLLHQPFSDYYGSYRALEDLYEEKKIRAIGVSNFYPDRLSDLAAFNRITPQINQVETNPFNQQIKAQENMVRHNVQIEAWAPFAEGKNDLFHNKILDKIAKKHNKSIAQVVLRWLIERDIVVLAKSVNKERMIQNLAVFDFNLDADDMAAIQSLDTQTSMFFSHQDPETIDRFVKMIEERKGKV